MTSIITTGCSFTHAPDSWANYLKEKYNITNVAEGGAGNEMNIRNAMLNIHKNNYTHCIVQISGINRFEVVVDQKINTNNVFLLPNENYTWIKSTGDQEWWHHWAKENNLPYEQTQLVGNALNNYIKHCYSVNEQILKTLMAIVNCQTLCKHKQIKQLYFCWKNEFDQYLDIINSSQELTNWWNQIDWSMFWFDGMYNGLSEWGINNNHTGALMEDVVNDPPQGWLIIDEQKTMIGHPSTECHIAFADQVIVPWVNNTLTQ